MVHFYKCIIIDEIAGCGSGTPREQSGSSHDSEYEHESDGEETMFWYTCTCTQHTQYYIPAYVYVYVYAPAQCTHVYGVHVTYMIMILYVYDCTSGGCTLWHGNYFEFQNIEFCKSQCLIHHTTRDGARDSRTRDNVYIHARVIIGHFTGTL